MCQRNLHMIPRILVTRLSHLSRLVLNWVTGRRSPVDLGQNAEYNLDWSPANRRAHKDKIRKTFTFIFTPVTLKSSMNLLQNPPKRTTGWDLKPNPEGMLDRWTKRNVSSNCRFTVQTRSCSYGTGKSEQLSPFWTAFLIKTAATKCIDNVLWYDLANPLSTEAPCCQE